MDASLSTPRRSKTAKTTISPPGKCPSTGDDGAVSPRRASSLLRGTVKTLASGRLGSGSNNKLKNDDSLAEVTLSLSKSSGWSSQSSHCAVRNRNDANDDESSQGSRKVCYAVFLDSFQRPSEQPLSPQAEEPDDNDSLPDPYLDYPSSRTRRPKSQSMPSPMSIPPARISLGDCLEDFMTAYTSPAAVDWCPEPSQPTVMSKTKATTLKNTSRESLSTSSKSNENFHLSRQEKNYWSSLVTNRMMTLGMLHRQTAEAYLSLGHAHMRLSEYSQAMGAFQSCCKIFKSLDGATHLSVSRALDAFGLAALRNKQLGAACLIQAKTALEEAFAIRFHNLGVWHVDTVETFNKIAGVYLHLGRLEEAVNAYREVYLVRLAIYGSQHASVAVSAHGLGNVYLKLKRPEESIGYFQIALNIYRGMRLPKHHPTVTRLLQDRKQLKRYLHAN